MRKIKKILRVLLTLVSFLLTLFFANVEIQAEEIYEGEELYVHFYDPTPVQPHPDFPNQGENETGPMFYEMNIAPGDSFQREVSVRNASDFSKVLQIRAAEVETIGGLSEALIVSVTGGSDAYEGTLYDLYSSGEFMIDILGPKEERLYEIQVTFDEQAGNKYMNTSTEFDYLIGFSGETVEDGEVEGVSDERLPETGSVLGVTGQFIFVGIGVGSILVLSYLLPKVLKRFPRN